MRAGHAPLAAVLPLLAALAVIAGVLFLQHAEGLRPCELCLAERWPWYGAVLVSGAMWLWSARVRRARSRLRAEGWGTALLTVLFLGSAGLASYHVAVEQHWVAGPGACTGSPLSGKSPAEALRALMATPVVRCDEVQWRWLGVSLAGWNAVLSLGLALFTAYAGWTSYLEARHGLD